MKKIFIVLMFMSICVIINFKSLNVFANENESTEDLYFEPAYGDEEIVYSDENEEGASSYKDEYENNNNFSSASNISVTSVSIYGDTSKTIHATLHDAPWYYIFWRDIDEDYYRLDVFGDAYLEVSLSMPSHVNYDLELFERYDTNNSLLDSDHVPVIGFSRTNTTGATENIIINDTNQSKNYLTPGTYYLRVFSRGDESYDNFEEYTLSYTLTYLNQGNEYISKLRFNKGAKAAFWKSDFDPFGQNLYEIENNYLFNPLTKSPIHESINSLATDYGVVNSVLYIWDTEWRNGLADYLDSIIVQLMEINNNNTEIKVTLESIEVVADCVVFVLDIVSIATGLPIIASIGQGIDYTVSGGIFLSKVFLPDVWSTTIGEAVDYFTMIRNILECSNNEDTTEVIAIRYKYQYGVGNISIVKSINYQESFLYDSDSINLYNSDSHTFGKVYPITCIEDFSSFISTCEVESKPDINTCETIREVSIDEIVSGSLIPGKYYWYKFIAPFNGDFRFYSASDWSVCGEIFSNIVPGDSASGRIKVDNQSGEENNFSIVYNMAQGETVYIRVRGSAWSGSGPFSFSINGDEHIHDYTYIYLYNSPYNHIAKCECGDFIYESHNYMTFLIGMKCTECMHYTEGPVPSQGLAIISNDVIQNKKEEDVILIE